MPAFAGMNLLLKNAAKDGRFFYLCVQG